MATRDQIGHILVQARLIDELQLRAAKARQDQWGGRLPHVVAEMGLATEDRIVEALAKALHVPAVDPLDVPKDASALARLDVAFAEYEGVYPLQLKEQGKVLVVAMTNPTDLELVDNVSRKARARIVPMLAGERQIQNAIRRHYRNEGPLPPPRNSPPPLTHAPDRELSAEDLGGSDDDAPIVMGVATNTGNHAAVPAPKPHLSRALTDSQAMLADILSDTPQSAFTAEDEARIRALAENQQKSGLILRAVHQLLKEKGYL